jgi:hypothetical protein
MSDRSKPHKCAACEDACEINLSAFCDEPVTIKANVDFVDRTFKTVYPTNPSTASEQQCEATKQTCTDLFARECDNMYRIDHSPAAAQVSGRARATMTLGQMEFINAVRDL